ncbi:hypothetical protein GCM10028811_12690 [Uliginosibacterium sediminicola]
MTESDAREFFEGRAFADWSKARELENRMQSGIAERLNSVIQALGVVAKVTAGIGRRR